MTRSPLSETGTDTATLGGGCFWCLEAIFQRLPGVLQVEPGYAGGTRPDPTYEEVCRGDTGHAEVVRITFDPRIISYEELLGTFWRAHDPTTLNRQGADQGTQYRSILLYTSEEQRLQAEKSRDQWNAKNPSRPPAVTQVVPLERFFPAEEYHHDYYRNNPRAGYCRLVIQPKVEALFPRDQEQDRHRSTEQPG
ncbi:peptide-methionine (S)-S-oxide reductase [Alkalispirochaeta americana]|uniref:Peptide methionine sulfoxide reductase MsrA n=1 Tax=Alkalispirochaeta americana TaxID=159291 RepID=A0A1N6WE05_9SPIO|nr:peptide-methionine (S)-S-oxide reductase MsrA [Alkalispirochaeta americana]SIQ88195.1 peptide-methionine (S)-S-oxide reductase [Alkalispirochaeta americana]